MPSLNRAARREIERDVARYRRKINEGSDETRPLKHRGGYVHNVCGGDAEVPNNRAVGAFCAKCDRYVPRAEVSRR